MDSKDSRKRQQILHKCICIGALFISITRYNIKKTGQALPNLSQEIKGRIWKKIVDLAIKNKYFGGGFGGEVAEFIESIRAIDFENILYLAIRDYAFAVSLGMVCAATALSDADGSKN